MQVESRLHETLPEFLNAEVAMRVVTSVAQAHRWLQSTFLWVRALQNPAHYGLQVAGGANAQQAVAQAASQRFLDAALARLEAQGLLQVQRATGDIAPLAPGECGLPNCVSRHLHANRVLVISPRVCKPQRRPSPLRRM